MNQYSDKTDEELLRQYHLEKNPYFLNILFTRYADIGFRTAIRYMRNESDAEDVLQLSFIQFLQNLHLFREGATTIKPWLLKMIVNTSLNKLKEEKRRTDRQNNAASEKLLLHEDKETQIASTHDHENLKKKIKNFVDALPDRYRSPIWLVLYEGCSYPEVASVLSLPEKTVRTQVARGLEKLREQLNAVGFLLSATSILSLITESKLEAAPITVKNLIDSPHLYKKIPSASSKILPNTTKINTLGKTKPLLVCIIMLGAILGYFYLIKSSTSKLVSPSIKEKPFFLSLNFDQPIEKIPYVHQGDYQYLEKKGLRQSSCLQFKNNFIMKIPIKKDQLPIKITYRWNMKRKATKESEFFTLTIGQVFWNTGWKKKGVFLRLSEIEKIDLGRAKELTFIEDDKWGQQTCWVTENTIDIWCYLNRHSVTIIDPTEEGSYLYLKLNKDQIIDDLLITTVDRSEIPDLSGFIKANEMIFENTSEQIINPIIYMPELSKNKAKPVHKKIPAIDSTSFSKVIEEE